MVAGMAGSGLTVFLAAIALWIESRGGGAEPMSDRGEAIVGLAFLLFLLFPMVGAFIHARREIREQAAWEK